MKTKRYIYALLLTLPLLYSLALLGGSLESVLAQESSDTANVKNELGEPLVTLDYKDASLPAVLRALSYSYNLNLVATKDIQGKVTVNLTNVTIDEALEAILSVNGYAFTRKGNLIYITPGAGTEGIDFVTTPIQLKYLTAAEAQKLLSKVISSKGDVQINEATNSLVVTDFPPNIEKIRKVLSEIDTAPIQVLIEAKIVDIQAKAYENFGTTYTMTYSPTGGLFKRSTTFDESLTSTTTLAGPSPTLSGGQLSLTATLHDFSATATIDALIQSNKAHLLASPSIATLSGKEARIIIGEKFPYKEKTQTTTGTTETTRFIDVGTTLRVTPLVSPDNSITMNVHPEVSSVSAALDAGPRITTREADATIRVADGQTIIIGGLISKKDDRIKGGVPFLRSIPILGGLFSKRSQDLEETELTVFITPHIIRSTSELAKNKDINDQEVYLRIEGVGNSDLLDKMLEHARNLENDYSPESANKSLAHRKEEMLRTYQMIASQFPQSQSVDFALYKIGFLYYDYFREYKTAQEIFSKLIADHPQSSYLKEALMYQKKSEEAQAKQEKEIQEMMSLGGKK